MNPRPAKDVPKDGTVLPTLAHYSGVQCSTAHITDQDNHRLWHASHSREEYGTSEWIHYTGTGYLIRLSAWTHPLLKLKQLGLSKPARHLIAALQRRYGITQIHLDALGEVLPGFPLFEW